MNAPSLPPKVDHPLDRRAALAGLFVLHVLVGAATSFLWKAFCEWLEWKVVSFPADCLTNAWLLVSATCLGFYAAFGSGMRILRLAVVLAVCQWIVIVYTFGRWFGAGSPGDEPFLSFLVTLLVIGEVAAGLSVFRLLSPCELIWRGKDRWPREKRGQFRLWDLMLLTMTISMILGTTQWFGPSSIPPIWSFGWRIWIEILVMTSMAAALAVASILVAYGRISVILCLVGAAAIACADALFFLVLEVPLLDWPNAAVERLLPGFAIKLVFLPSCVATMLVIRWLGYDLRQPAVNSGG